MTDELVSEATQPMQGDLILDEFGRESRCIMQSSLDPRVGVELKSATNACLEVLLDLGAHHWLEFPVQIVLQPLADLVTVTHFAQIVSHASKHPHVELTFLFTKPLAMSWSLMCLRPRCSRLITVPIGILSAIATSA